MRVRRVKENQGFTLLEVIFALAMAALLAAVVGMGVVKAVDSYIYAKENAKLNQRVQVALERIKRECTEITSVTAVNAAALSYTGFGGTYTIGLEGGALKMAEGSTALSQGDILLDNVTSLSFALKKENGSLWDVDFDDDRQLSSIEIVIAVNHTSPDVGPLTFSATINPRNTENPLGPLNVVTTTTTTTTTLYPPTTTSTTTSTTTTLTPVTTTTLSPDESTTTTTTTTSTTLYPPTTTTTLPPDIVLTAVGAFACKKNGNKFIYFKLYLETRAGTSVEDATVTWTLDDGSAGGLQDLGGGYYGGTATADCLLGGNCGRSSKKYNRTVTVAIAATKSGYYSLTETTRVP